MRRLLLLMIAALALPAYAQVFNMEQDRVPITPLDGLMRFHTGDSPLWSEPGFDDSTWPLISPQKSWSEQGYKDYGGLAWYRFKVLLPPGRRRLALYLPSVLTSYQVFADGRLIGSFGGFPPEAAIYDLKPHLLPLPPAQASEMDIAIRVWHWPDWAMVYGGGLTGPPLIGDAAALTDWKMLQDKNTFWALSAQNCTALLCFLYCVAGFTLFLIRRNELEYLWYGLLGFCFCASPLVSDYASFHDLPIFVASGLGNMLSTAGFFCFVMFTWTLLGRKDTLWVWLSAASLALVVMIWTLPPLLDLSVSSGNSILIPIEIPMTIWPMIMLIQGVRRGNPDARLLLIPQGLNTLANWVNDALLALRDTGYPWVRPVWLFWNRTFHWPFPFGLYDLSIWVIVLAVLAVVVLRFARSRHEEDQMKGELQAARMVQQVLVPAESPSVPGFAIESVYRPASEVGGDFYQIVATAQGGVLAVIGDVSGKGMPAAMTVSLLVGTFRTLAHYTQSPGEILTAMNQRMLARSQGGFTTCLVLRADAGGKVTLANAGHIAPYVAGGELSTESGLPLGLDGGATYAESSFPLEPGAQLTLMTDGVVESRNAAGELFGFERTAAISTQSAEEIARAAQAFGQEDDITALTLTRATEEATHA
jgi:hypothetical protein